MKKQSLLLLSLFIVFIFTTPVVFAYVSPTNPNQAIESFKKEHESNIQAAKARSSVTSSPSFITFRCQKGMNLRSSGNLNTVKTVLRKDSIIQLPNFPKLGIDIQEYDKSGNIDLKKTVRNWLEVATYQSERLVHEQLLPKYRNGTAYLPVKVIQASDPNFDTQADDGRNAYGYLALDFLVKKIDRNCYKTTTTTLEEITGQPPKKDFIGPPAPDSENNFSETTQFGGGFYSPSEDFIISDPSSKVYSSVFNCDNTIYRRTRYAKHSCLKDMSLEEKAKLVINDILEINRLRPELPLDPRFSLCVAYRESLLAPNAKGASDDYGMYQITNSTARFILRLHRPVTPEFTEFGEKDQAKYRTLMLQSTLAQADMHHSIMLQKARRGNGSLLARLQKNPENTDALRTLATRYNGTGRRATRYGRKVANCFDAMKKVMSNVGEIHNPSGLQKALNKAKG